MTAARKVLLVGWDAADWKMIHPLMDRGLMPATKRLVEGGVMANQTTLSPVLSPMLWTSIATGKRPYKHGILGFSEPTPDGTAVQPVSGLSRKTKAIWNILNQTGKRSLVVGWWPSHPAEPINGVMVSNHYHQAPRGPQAAWPMAKGTVHPPELAEELAALRFHPREVTEEHIRPFIPMPSGSTRTKIAASTCACGRSRSARRSTHAPRICRQTRPGTSRRSTTMPSTISVTAS
jgi:predicted AlkP superfamily phosphohydrolase/phosphomutase